MAQVLGEKSDVAEIQAKMSQVATEGFMSALTPFYLMSKQPKFFRCHPSRFTPRRQIGTFF